MVKVVFTSNLQRLVDCPPTEADGATVGDVLQQAFEQHSAVRGYVLDEHGRLRKHMAVFVDGQPLRDPQKLSDRVRPDSEIYVMQALSGG